MIALSLSGPSHPPSSLPIRKLFHWQPDGSLTFRVDWSSIESLLGCNRSAEYKLVRSRQGGSRSALTFGAAIHAGLEVWYRNKDQTHNEDLRQALLSRCYSAIESTFAESPPSLFPDYRTSAYAVQSFHSYITHYKDEVMTPYVHEGKPLVEFSFAFPLGQVELPTGMFKAWGYGTLTNDAAKELACDSEVKFSTTYGTQLPKKPLTVHIEWSGIIDMLAEVNGSLYVVDHKTSSIISQDFFDGFEIAMQPTGYFAAMRAAFPDLPIKGFMANVLACRKPVAAITKGGRPTTSKPFEPHRRQYQYHDWHVTEFKQDALALAEELFANITNKYFPRKTQWCIGKYGKCPFFDVCALPPESRLDMLNSDNYINNTWKPV